MTAPDTAHQWVDPEAPTHEPDQGAAVTRRLRAAAHVVLAVVAGLGAALSYTSLQAAAAVVFHHSPLAYGFPLLVDALVLGASLQYVAAARDHTGGRFGWRATAHAGIGATLYLNALAAHHLAEVPWHVTAPAVWAVLVELYARTAAGQWAAEHATPGAAIPARLWATAPIESARTWLRQARLSAAVTARFDVGRHAAALEALRLTIPGRPGRRVRRIIRRQLRTGSLTPTTVLTACGWTPEHTHTPGVLDPTTVLRNALTPEHVTPEHAAPEHVTRGHVTSGQVVREHGELVPVEHGAGHARRVGVEHTREHAPPARLATEHGRPGEGGHVVPTPTVSEHASEHTVPGPMGPDRAPEHTREHAVAGPVLARSGVVVRAWSSPLTPVPGSSPEAADEDPDPVPESALSDAEIVAAILATGDVPSVRAIKATHRVGNARAARIRAQIQNHTPSPSPTARTAPLNGHDPATR